MMGPGFADAAARDAAKMTIAACIAVILVAIGVEHAAIYLYHHISLRWK